MRRVSVIGSSGAGKSTCARELGELLGVPVIELDAVQHLPDWRPIEVALFRERVNEFVQGDAWVVDGNYSDVRDLVWARADTVIWLDLSRRVVMRRIAIRTLGRIAGRTELWNGNREGWRHVFTLDPRVSLLAWAWTTFDDRRRRYEAAMSDPGNAKLQFVRLKSPREVRRFRRALAQPARR